MFPRHLPSLGLLLPLVIGAHSATLASSAPSTYTAVELGTLGGGTSSTAAGLNNRGQVVGSTLYQDGGYRATLFSGTGTNNIDLGTLGGPYSTAAAINDLGQIVGTAWTTDGLTHATLFSGGTGGNIDLGTLGGMFSSASDINNNGVIVGSSVFPGSREIATRFGTGGTSTNVSLYFLDGHIGPSNAASINSQGDIVGTSTQQTWGNGYAGSVTIFVEGGENGSNNRGTAFLDDYHPSSYAAGSNDLGQFVGAVGNAGSWTWTAPSQAALFTLSGTTTGLGFLPGQSTSSAFDINNRGQIIGASGTSNFLWENGVMYDFADLLISDQFDAADLILSRINDWGQIAATVRSSNRALLLNPSTPLTTVTGDSRNTKFVAGTSYAASGSTTLPGMSTTFDLLAGTAGSAGTGSYGLNRDVTITVSDYGGSPFFASDVVSISGTRDDIIAVSLSYDTTRYAAQTVSLAWLDENDSLWKLAIDGNTFPPGELAGEYRLTFSEFLNLNGGIFDAQTMLGAYGSKDGSA
jgi:probable HAF family extracellular repeat protein